MTRASASTAVPRPEHPRPQLVRRRWLNLNGDWQLAYDADDRGLREGWMNGLAEARRIVVPFCIESPASAVADAAPPGVVWYQRSFSVPQEWLQGPRLMLHVGACDRCAHVFVNGLEVGRHEGGYAPFSCDVRHAVRSGDNRLTVRVTDTPLWTHPRGKQAGTIRWPVDYDGVTGIWQTVWLEPLPRVAVERLHVTWNGGAGEAVAEVALSDWRAVDVEIVLDDGARTVAAATDSPADRRECRLTLAVAEPRLWSPADPFLYGVTVRVRADGQVIDEATSYTGLREIVVHDGRLLLNGEPLYVRGVLDQGYFPGGWYTAPRDEDLRRDIELTLAMGFNLARKHQKAEEPRYLYWADRLGLLVWAEMPSGRMFGTELVQTLTREWLDLVVRDRGHPSVVGWVPFNESWGVWGQTAHPEQRAFVEGVAQLTRALDPSRPVIGNDGWEYAAGDLWTLHLYGDEHSIADRIAGFYEDPGRSVTESNALLGPRPAALPGTEPRHLPCLVTECGGIGFVAPGGARPENVFAYGPLPEDEPAFESAVAAVTDDLGRTERIGGFVWTQLTDVQQEVNGLLDFERRPKLPLARLRELFTGVGGKEAAG